MFWTLCHHYSDYKVDIITIVMFYFKNPTANNETKGIALTYSRVVPFVFFTALMNFETSS